MNIKELSTKLDWEVELLKEYSKRSISGFSTEVADIENDLKNGNFHPLQEDSYVEEHFFISVGLGYATHSSIIMIYSFFESFMKDLVSFSKEKCRAEIKLSDLKGGAFESSIIFLEKIAKVPLDGLDKARLKQFNSVRNAIVHSDGVTQQGDRFFNEIEKLMAGNSNIRLIEDSGYIDVNLEFVLEYIDLVGSQAKLIINALLNWSEMRPVT